MSLAYYEYIYPVFDTMQGRARAPPHRPTLHSQTVPYRPHRPGDARRHVAHEVSGATSRVREQWRQRVQAPPKQLITTQRPVYLNNNLAFLKATTTNILT